MPEQPPAAFLVKLTTEEKARATSAIKHVQLPAGCLWLQLTQCSGDTILVPYHNVEWILIKDSTVLARMNPLNTPTPCSKPS